MAAVKKRSATFSIMGKITLDAHVITRAIAFFCDWNESKKRFDPPTWATSKDKVVSWVGNTIVLRGTEFFRSDAWRADIDAGEAQAAIRAGRAVGKRFFPELFN